MNQVHYRLGLARELGISAAILASYIERLQFTGDEPGGWCHATKANIADATALSRRAIDRSISALCNAGYLSSKVDFVEDTTLRCLHFMLTGTYVSRWLVGEGVYT